jgi:hypothetical protein
MNTRGKTIVMAVALAAAAFSLGTQAAESAHEAAENQWLEAQRTLGSGSYAPIPFPVPNRTQTATPIKPETAHQAKEDQWLTQERGLEAGNVTPVPFPPPSEPAAH